MTHIEHDDNIILERNQNITIHKFPLIIADIQIIKIPFDSQILKVDTQFGSINLWARVKLKNKIQNRAIYMYGTGHPHFEIWQTYIGTIIINGNLVFHYYAGLDE